MARVPLKTMRPYVPTRNLNDLAVEAAGIWARSLKGRDLFTGPFDMEEFAAFLGDPYDPKRDIIVNVHNPEIVERLKKIVGPNGHTFLKILEIQNGAVDDGS